MRSRLWKWIKRLLVLAVLGVVAVVVACAVAYAVYSRDLPNVEELHAWRPPQVTKVTCRDGSTCAEFYLQRRTWVDINTLPKHVRDAFLAAEDADFYSHQGLDYLGILRSAVKNLRPGGMKSGASTISQQTCRQLLLTQERTLARKIREWILTPRMEAALTKDEILNLYVNTIYFGHNRYGVEEASLFYFGKHAKDLSIGEAAVIAGTVQLPHRINPVTNIVKAKKRQRYVLGQLASHGFVPADVIAKELEKPIVLGPRPPNQVGASYAEEVRKILVARYGDKAVLEGGLRVQIAMDPALQLAAENSVRAGLEAVDRRQGYRGPLGHVEAERFEALRSLLEKRLSEAGKRKPDERFVADLTVLKDLKPPDVEEGADPLADPEEQLEPDEPVANDDERLARAITVRTLADGTETVAWVVSVDDAKGNATLDLVGAKAQLEFAAHKWARRRDGTKVGTPPTKMSEVVAPGDLVRVRLGPALPASQTLSAQLAQIPLIQGALTAIDPADRTVVALVGGYDFSLSAFNRATQAHRQPGSSFKPFLYATAMESTKFNPVSIVNDAPEAIRDPYTGKLWKPQNYEKSAFEGPITVRKALTLSKNTVSVRLIEAVGPDAVIAFAQKAGIKSPLPQNLTLALGTGEVSQLEIANAYATLQTNGQYADPVMVIRVADGKGKVLEERHAAPEQVLNPAVAFLATSLMRSVVEEGTATAVLELNRPAAGKTGTAQEFRDAWFTGYTADYVASAWVGFDDHEPIGPGETGGKAALPIWLGFMRVAEQGKPSRDFTPPEGVKQVRIDPRTGKLAGTAVPGRNEWFLEGTEPTEETRAVDPNDFLLNDGRK
ncbi:MAG: PBP1A family penicillin-binding protein [Myxococcaceae bacterium]